MKNSLKKLMILATTTTMLSGISVYALDSADIKADDAPKHTLKAAPASAALEVENKKTGCWSGFTSWLKRTFTKQHLETAADDVVEIVDDVAKIAGKVLPIIEDFNKKDEKVIKEIQSDIQDIAAVVDDLGKAVHANKTTGEAETKAK